MVEDTEIDIDDLENYNINNEEYDVDDFYDDNVINENENIGLGNRVNEYKEKFYKGIYNRSPKPIQNILTYINQIYWFQYSYLVDWIISLIILILSLGIPHFFIQPFSRVLFTDPPDPAINYPYTENTIPSWSLPFWSFILPLICFAITQGANLKRGKSFIAHDMHHITLTLLESVSICALLTNPTKYICGRPRPDLLDRMELFDEETWDYKNGFLSFPSGHASSSFSGLFVLSLYLSGKLKLFHPKDGQLYKLIICLIPFGIAGFIAISRTRDYRHNFSDILAGSLLGIFSSIIAYFLNYHSLLSEKCNMPKNRNSLESNDNNQDGIELKSI
eukprot:TRINITY_DN13054_c0_g1_i1.p1 TRINITY_DN13054_c0_g1~~TRINITY_DN13054_c0_g1_i1.p1  ORF type:complete len:333 (+),score=57.00 TRINITY_DN13054_c0_g1_i1:24-1022(+)